MAGSAPEESQQTGEKVEGEEKSPKQTEVVAGLDGQKVKNIVIHYAKLVGAALAIWTTGWLGLHYVWVVMGLLTYTLWRINNKEKERRMKALTEVTKNEQKVLAQMKDLPSWVRFPDMQRAEWLNEIVVQMWPFVGKMVYKILKEKVEPKMQEKLPGVIKSLYFEEISLGELAPKFGGIKVYKYNIARSEIIMDLDFIYAGDAVVKVKVKGLSAGITNIQIRGKIRLELNPLIGQAPLIGGISIYFLEDPKVDFDLTNLLNILDIPGLSDMLHCVVKEALSAFVVLPNRIKIPIGKQADLESLKYPMPDGVLRIEVVEAEELIAKDINVFSKNTSDPYVVLNVGTQTLRTKEQEETLNPVWNETFEMFIESMQGRKLKLQVFDQDLGSNDESLGRTEVSIEKIAKLGSSDFWLPLEGVDSGRIHLKCNWLAFSSKSSDLPKADKENQLATSALFVKLDSARNLPVTNEDDDTSNPFCTITVGNQIEVSKKLEDTAKPVWEEMFEFLVRDPRYQELNIQVHDSKTDKSLGRLDFPVDRLLKNKEMRFKQPFNLTGAKENSTLTMIIELKALVSSQAKEAGSTNIGKRDSSIMGEIEQTINWDTVKNKLFITIHRARDLVDKDNDPLNTYVKLNLLPDKTEAGYRETKMVKDKDPKFDQEFDYFIGYDEVKGRTLMTSVYNVKGEKHDEGQLIGEVLISLEKVDLAKGERKWYRLKTSG